MSRFKLLCVSLILSANGLAFGQQTGTDAEFKRFQGAWQVTELVENGQVVSQQSLKTMLESGGRAEIVSNTIQFKTATGQKSAKVFSVDPTVHPKSIVISSLAKPEGWGIYRFEGERLVICMSDPAVAQRPTDFASRAGSKHMLMVLERTDGPKRVTDSVAVPKTNTTPNTTPAREVVDVGPPPAKAPAPTAATARILTDVEVSNLLKGSWRMNDGAGVLQVSFDPNGSYRSYREVQDPSTFYRVFVQTPAAAGTWRVQNGNLVFHVTSSTDLNRVNRTFHVAVRSVSKQDLIFVDSVGRVGKAVRLR